VLGEKEKKLSKKKPFSYQPVEKPQQANFFGLKFQQYIVYIVLILLE